MPSIVLHTNVAVEDVRAFVSEFSKFCSETLGKTERFVSIQFQHNPDMSFGGTFEPTFVLTITSLSNINPEANERYSKAFFDHFEEKLGVSGERGYITFFDPGRQFMGFNGVTVETAFPSKK